MLYIEDFLELIEPFPQEIRERLTEMREIDLKIQNETDKLDTKIDTFFQQCKKQKIDWKNENYESIRKEYTELVENANDKIQIANQLYELIEKYIKKLDQELQKFKLELEADHAGITSKLEQVISTKNLSEIPNISSLNPTLSSFNFTQTPDDSDFTLCSSSTNDLVLMMLNNQSLNDNTSLNQNTFTNHKRKHSNFSDKNLNNNNQSFLNQNDEDSSSSWNSSNLNTIFNLNRKSSVNSTSLNNNNNNNNTNNKNRSLSTSSNTNRQNLDTNLLNLINSSIQNSNTNLNTKKFNKSKRPKLDTNLKLKNQNLINKKRLNDLDYDDEVYDDDENGLYQSDDNETSDETNEVGSEVTSSENGMLNQLGNEDDDNELQTSDDEADDNDDDNEDQMSNDFEHTNNTKLKMNKNNRNTTRQFKDDWNSGEDTNERYCICKDVSYGDMIMCDNTRCGTQWFHFVCVGLNSAPKGKWFCPNCLEIKKKRRERQLSTLLNANNNLNLTNLNNTQLNNSLSSSFNQTLTTTTSNSVNQNDLINQFVTSSNS